MGELASRLIEQTQGLAAELRATEQRVKAETAVPRQEAGVGVRTVVIQDLTHLEARAQTYREAIESNQGREDTRPLFGRIDSLMSMTSSDMRHLPDYASYRIKLEALQKTVAELGRFYAESIEVRTPTDPLLDLEKKVR